MTTLAPGSPARRTDRATLALHGGQPVTTSKIPFVAAGLAPEDIDAATAVLRSGMLRQGKKSDEFEKRFAAMTDAALALTCANGTCALQLAYEPLTNPGDEVLVPAWSYIATASMVVARGATPVFCDADPTTYQIDLADAERRITPRTTAIAPTHLYGGPVDIDAVQRLAAKHHLRVVYDAAQAHLARWKGRGIGAFGDAVTYSFYATKNISTGEGGMVTVNDPGLARQIGLLRSHGETGKYLHEHIGFNYRMTDVEAAIGLSQLDRAEAITKARQANAAALDRLIAQIPGLAAPAVTPGGEHVYHQYAVRMEAGAFACDRDTFIRALDAEGVSCAVHYPRALTQQPAFNRFITDHPPVAERLAGCLFCIPVHQRLTAADITTIGEALAKVAAAFHA